MLVLIRMTQLANTVQVVLKSVRGLITLESNQIISSTVTELY